MTMSAFSEISEEVLSDRKKITNFALLCFSAKDKGKR